MAAWVMKKANLLVRLISNTRGAALNAQAPKRKASVIGAARVAVEALAMRALETALAQHAAALDALKRRGHLSSSAAAEEALAKAQVEAEELLMDMTKAVAPMPRGAGAPPQPPTLKLRAEMRTRAKQLRVDFSKQAAKESLDLAQALHGDLVDAADQASRLARGLKKKSKAASAAAAVSSSSLSSSSSAAAVLDEEEEDDDETAAPTSRRAELWLSTYKGRLATVKSEHLDAAADRDAATEALGRLWGVRASEVLRDRLRHAVSILEGERRAMVEKMEDATTKTAALEADLAGVLDETRAAMKRHHADLAQRMQVSETAKMDQEAALSAATMDLDSVVRAADRLEQRLKVKLDGNVSRAVSRVADAKGLVRKVADFGEHTARLEAALADSRLDALRVRCVTLGHEKANLGEHMELLEEHLERLKADLDHKQAEVAEVEHQWAQTKSRLPALKTKHRDAEKLRHALADIAKKLKAHAKKDAKAAQLPRALLQQLDPMERQALDDL